MSRTDYYGVILAAGRGSRMQPFSERYPKPLLPIRNKPIIVHQIEFMRELGIRKIVVLIGHKGFEISKELGDGSHLGVSIRYVEQTSMLGIAHAVGRLEPYIDGPFLLFLGDIFFVARDMNLMFQIFEANQAGAVLATKEEDDPEAIRRNFSLNLSPEGNVTRVVEKPRHTSNRLKGAGIYLFDLAIFDAIRRTPRTAMRDEYELTESIQVMIEDGHAVWPANVIVEDINLTNPVDLLRCNLMNAGSANGRAIIGENTCLHPEAKIDNSVIGANVIVENPISIANSLIFDGTRVDARVGFDNVIVTPDGLIDCRYLEQIVPSSAKVRPAPLVRSVPAVRAAHATQA
jgi:dTDP-glucose pyrophosphorylase